MYAVIKTGGKQYRVQPGTIVDVELLPTEAGGTVEFPEVLMVENDGDITFGSPIVAGARVVGEVLEHGKSAKVVIGTYKSKVRTRRRVGHRQQFTRVAIREISAGGSQ